MPAKVTVRTNASVRTKVVWAALVASMTGLAGVLSVLDSGHESLSAQGVSLSPLASITAGRGVDAIYNTKAELSPENWDSIIIVHSGSPAGSAESIGAQHKAVGYDGLSYHFVIGNGTGMGDGEIHLGNRWLTQASGAQLPGLEPAQTARSIEICLVGNGDRKPFTDEQIRYLAQVVTSLSEKLDIPSDKILLHDDLAPTTSPGRFFPRASFNELLGKG
ncbi:MAG: peptidoglycan recognition family protein [Phycisphaerales bacterium]